MRLYYGVGSLSLILQCFFGSSASIQLWSSPGALPLTIPAACRAELSKNITCSPKLFSAQFVANGGAIDNKTATQYCTSSCSNSLASFKTNVDLRCGNTLYQMFPNSTHLQSGASVADPLAWAYNVTCIKDSTGYCLLALYNGTKTKCSDCSLKYGAAMLSSDYGRARVKPKAFSSLLASCSVPATKYPYTYTTTSAVSTSTATKTGSTTTAPAQATCTGTKYTVVSADTCQTISKAKLIATDRLIADNKLDYNCTSLKVGTSLCLGATCALQTVVKNQTCADIASGKQFTTVQLISWNPTIHASCDNLDVMIGRSICVSPPGSPSYIASKLNTTTAAMTSMFPGPYTTGVADANPPTTNTSWYNSQTTFKPPATSTNFNNLTTVSLVQARTSYCPLSEQDILDGVTIYDLPDACADLLDPYCNVDPDAPVLPSTRFPAVCTRTNQTASATATPPPTNAVPAPLEPSTVASCKKYYQVLSGDNCYSIANNFKITLTQFNTWNPYVNTGGDCAKLFLGYYVCILA